MDRTPGLRHVNDAHDDSAAVLLIAASGERIPSARSWTFCSGQRTQPDVDGTNAWLLA